MICDETFLEKLQCLINTKFPFQRHRVNLWHAAESDRKVLNLKQFISITSFCSMQRLNVNIKRVRKCLSLYTAIA
jgi:hypothetical protein